MGTLIWGITADKEQDIKIPIVHVNHIEALFHTQEGDICVNGKKYYTHYDVVEKPNSNEIVIGNWLTLTFGESTGSFKFSLPVLVSERIKAIEMILDIFEVKCIEIKGNKIG